MKKNNPDRPLNPKPASPSTKDRDGIPQAEKFAQAAREHGADQDEEAFKGVLRKLAKPKAEGNN